MFIVIKTIKSKEMQKIVLDEIIKAEREAEKIVQQSRKEAAEIVAKADSDYTQAIALAKEESHKNIQDSIIAAKQKAENALAKAIKDAEDENSILLEKSCEQADKVANQIVEMLLKPEYERE